MSLRITDFESLLWIDELGSHAAAADRLHVTQSAITRRMHQMETLLGVDLFERQGRRAVLTVEGQRVLNYAQRIVDISEEMRRDLSAPRRSTGRLRLGVGELLAGWWLPQFVQEMDRVFPDLSLDLDIDVVAQHHIAFEKGQIDMILQPGEPPAEGEHLLLGLVTYQVMASGQCEADDTVYSAADIGAQKILTISPGSAGMLAMDRWLRENGARPTRLERCNNLAMLAEMVAIGKGVAFLPEPALAPRLASGEIRVLPVDPPPPQVPVWLTFRAEANLPCTEIAELAMACHLAAAGGGD